MEEEVSNGNNGTLSPWYSGKTAARLLAAQGAYALMYSDRSNVEVDELFEHLWEMKEVLELERVDKKLLIKLLGHVVSKSVYVDSIISENISERWSLDRINLISRAIMRAGICELLYLPTNNIIVINEYVKIAAGSLDNNEINFINAILNKAKCNAEKTNGSSTSSSDKSLNGDFHTLGAGIQMVGFEFTDALENHSLNF